MLYLNQSQLDLQINREKIRKIIRRCRSISGHVVKVKCLRMKKPAARRNGILLIKQRVPSFSTHSRLNGAFVAVLFTNPGIDERDECVHRLGFVIAFRGNLHFLVLTKAL